tara:strand:+ start:69 stop:272 length:204 start_codon:yes stop_codon:yes gene_type:complete
MAKAEMKRLNIEFKEVKQTDTSKQKLVEVLNKKQYTYPQIWDDKHHIGGYTDLLDYTEEMTSTGLAM